MLPEVITATSKHALRILILTVNYFTYVLVLYCPVIHENVITLNKGLLLLKQYETEKPLRRDT